jgi:hypothetical protein
MNQLGKITLRVEANSKLFGVETKGMEPPKYTILTSNIIREQNMTRIVVNLNLAHLDPKKTLEFKWTNQRF